jgi:hypothetical protein
MNWFLQPRVKSLQSKDPHGEFIFGGVEIYPLTTTDFWVNLSTGETKLFAETDWVSVVCRPIDLQRYVIVNNELKDYRNIVNIRQVNAIPLFHT